MDDLDDVRWEVEEDGRLVRRELDRRVIERAGWATVIYLYQDLDPKTEAWRPARVALVRYRRLHDQWRRHASFNLTADAQLTQLHEALAAWLSPEARAERGDAGGPDDDDQLS